MLSLPKAVRSRAMKNKEKIQLFILLSLIMFPIHELSHIVVQMIFNVPVSVKLYWYGISTNENIMWLATANRLGFFSVVIAGFVGSLMLFPFLKLILNKFFPGFESRNGMAAAYFVFILSAVAIAGWDLVLFFSSLIA